LPIWLFGSQILKFWLLKIKKKPDKIWLLFSQKGLGLAKNSLSYIHYSLQILLARVYDHAGFKEYCKDFAVAIKMLDVFNKKQMHDSVITGK